MLDPGNGSEIGPQPRWTVNGPGRTNVVMPCAEHKAEQKQPPHLSRQSRSTRPRVLKAGLGFEQRSAERTVMSRSIAVQVCFFIQHRYRPELAVSDDRDPGGRPLLCLSGGGVVGASPPRGAIHFGDS